MSTPYFAVIDNRDPSWLSRSSASGSESVDGRLVPIGRPQECRNRGRCGLWVRRVVPSDCDSADVQHRAAIDAVVDEHLEGSASGSRSAEESRPNGETRWNAGAPPRG